MFLSQVSTLERSTPLKILGENFARGYTIQQTDVSKVKSETLQVSKGKL